MAAAEQVLEAHGFGGDRLLKLSRKIANDELRRRGAFLDHDRLEDLVAFLALKGVQAAVRYDPERPHAKYGSNGGGDHFSSWLADILSHRVTDWYRSKAEGGGDRRYHNDNRIVLDGDMSYAAPDDFDREVELQRREQGVDFDEAEQAIAERHSLSDEARSGLRIIRLRTEGYHVAGKGTVRARKVAQQEIARRVLKPRRTRRKRADRRTMANGVTKPPLLTLPDVSARLNYSERTIRRWVTDGSIPAIRIAGGRGSLRFDADEVERWIAGQRIGGARTAA